MGRSDFERECFFGGMSVFRENEIIKTREEFSTDEDKKYYEDYDHYYESMKSNNMKDREEFQNVTNKLDKKLKVLKTQWVKGFEGGEQLIVTTKNKRNNKRCIWDNKINGFYIEYFGDRPTVAEVKNDLKIFKEKLLNDLEILFKVIEEDYTPFASVGKIIVFDGGEIIENFKWNEMKETMENEMKTFKNKINEMKTFWDGTELVIKNIDNVCKGL
ncbi:MAG: hypothetical protein ACRC4M_04565 [Mycoplasma sp.]